jgi:hypothetical protein
MEGAAMIISIIEYRIHPSWFAPDTPQVIINELAEASAARMGRVVADVKLIGQGEDFGGQYIDFRVTYSRHCTILEFMR